MTYGQNASYPQKPKTEDDGGIGDSNRLAAAQVTNDSVDSGKSPKRLSKTAHNTLSEIFRKIGSKENTKEVSFRTCSQLMQFHIYSV